MHSARSGNGYKRPEDSWSELLEQLLERGLSGVELVIADEHAVLAAAVRRFLPEVRRQRCTVHLQRNVLAKVPHRLRKRVAREVAAVFRAPGLAKAKKRRFPSPSGPGYAPRTASSACTPRSSVESGAPAPSPTEPVHSASSPRLL